MAASSRWRAALRIVGSVFGALALLVFFTYLNFPVAAVLERYRGNITRALGAKVEFAGLSTYRLSGVQASSITLTFKPAPGDKPAASSDAHGDARRDGATATSAKPDARREGRLGARGETSAALDEDGPSLTINDFRARVGILPFLFSKKLDVSMGLKVAGGTIEAEFVKAPAKWSLKGDAKGIQLERIGVLVAKLGVEPAGAFGAKIDLVGEAGGGDKQPSAIRWAETNGKIEIHVSPFKLPSFDYKYKLPGEHPGETVAATQKIPAMTLTPLSAVLDVEAGSIYFTPDKVNIKASDIEVNVKGVVRLSNAFKDTSYDLWITFRFTDTFIKANQILTMLPSLDNFKSAYNSSTKSYGFRYRGTMARADRAMPAPSEPFGLMPPRPAKPAVAAEKKR